MVYDNFMRGLPDWLSEFESKGLLTLKKHNILDPLTSDIGDISYAIHAASIASPIYYRKHPIETMDANVDGLRNLLEFLKREMMMVNLLEVCFISPQVKFMAIQIPVIFQHLKIIEEMFHALVLEHAMTNQNDMGKLYV